jgi:Fe(3+) dicitrate transport protein
MKMEIKKRLLITCITFFTSFFSFSATIKLNLVNKQLVPLKKATIYCLNDSELRFSEKDGIYTSNQAKAKTYHLIVYVEFYQQKKLSIIVKSDEEVLIQTLTFTEEIIDLDTISLQRIEYHQLGELNDDQLIGSKKTETIEVEELTASKGTNNANQVFYRSPLTNIVQIDGAGIQLGIGGRGLDPHRSANFSIRQNGYDISADALGYPESYYTPPTEAIEKVEVLRGAAALQFGSQFGGVVNFKLKHAYSKPFEVKTRQTIGSFGFINSYNSLGGTTKKNIKYFAFYQNKSGKDYRPNAHFNLQSVHGHIELPLGKKLVAGLDQTYMTYLAQQPGGLTDQEFNQDPKQSNRERNWFEIKWYVPALALTYFPNANWLISIKTYGLVAARNSVGNLGQIDRPDNLNSNRDIILGKFKNIGQETRAVYSYLVKNKEGHLNLGYRMYYAKNQNTQGTGNNATDANFTINSDQAINNKFTFPNSNFAFFAENLFHLTQKLSITPGFRFEHIRTKSQGFYRQRTTDLAGNDLINILRDETLDLPRSFLIGGLGASYQLRDSISKYQFYTNFTQNYRSVTFSDLRVNNPNLLIDSTLHDEKGYNFDIGIRGEKPQVFDFDVSFFALHYNDRIGEVLKKVPDPILITTTKRVRSNLSDASIYGVELFAEYNLIMFFNASSKKSLYLFVNTAALHSRYKNAKDPSIENNQVEYAPSYNQKIGLILKGQKLSSTLQFNYTSQQFSDASNANDHPNATVGVIPQYHFIDWAFGWQIYKHWRTEFGVNNLTNHQYFTKRATGYPGPGILPATGRNLYLTIEAKF